MPRRTSLLASIALLALGCESVPSESSRPPARPVPNALPARVVPALFDSTDSDSNGLTDSLVVFAYLFPETAVSPLPVWSEGEFRFALIGSDDTPIANWTFPAEQVRAHRDSDTFGPTHSFTLDIKAAAGTDNLPAQNAALSATFIRTDGVSIQSAGSVGIRLGAR